MNIKVQATVFRYFLKVSYKGNKLERRIILTNFNVIEGNVYLAESYKTLICSIGNDNGLFELNLNNGDVIEFDAEYVNNNKNYKKSFFRSPKNIIVISRQPIVNLTGFGINDEYRNPYTYKYCSDIDSTIVYDYDDIFHAYRPEFYGYELGEGDHIQENLIC